MDIGLNLNKKLWKIVHAWDSLLFIGNGQESDSFVDGWYVSNWGKQNTEFYNSSFLFNMIFFYPNFHKNIYLIDSSKVVELKERKDEKSLIGEQGIKAFLENNLKNYNQDYSMRRIYEKFLLDYMIIKRFLLLNY